jgi:dihydroorotase
MAISLTARRLLAWVALATLPLTASAQADLVHYDTVIENGRVMDPESGLDAVRNIGITDGRIVAISEAKLHGGRTIDARGLVVAPGFIDLHSHAQDPASNLYQAHDGVTTALELEMGVYPVAKWYDQLAGKMIINYGATVSHTVARAAPVLGQELIDRSTDPYGDKLVSMETVEKLAATTLTPEQDRVMASALQRGIDHGALGVGMAIQYTAGADKIEVYRAFEVAARNGLTLFVHQRSAGLLPPDSIDSLQEMLADAATTGASVHVCHVGSSGLRQAPIMIEMIDAARSRGIDITTEIYPYAAAMAVYGSPLLRGDWRERYGIDYGDLESARTHARLTQETFERGRAETPDDPIVVYLTPQDIVDRAVAHRDVMIASDAVDVGRHPRTAGTFARVLGHYVRETGALTLMQALAKMTILPARRLEKAVPQMQRKGRLNVGADADLTIFDPTTVKDAATFEKPAQFSEGIVHVLVHGTAVVRDGRTVDKAFPGQPIRRQVAGSPGDAQ